MRALLAHHPSASSAPSTSELTAAFADYENIRLPRSAELVRRARARGEQRVAGGTGPKDVEKREEAWKEAWNEENIWKEFDTYAKGPFEGKSEI